MNDAEVQAFSRIQFAMWLPAWCAVCGREYESVDDFIARNPKSAPSFPDPRTGFVDEACWLPAFDAWVVADFI